MTLDSANRSFLALTLIALLLVTYMICAALGSAPLPLAASRTSRVGLAGAFDGGRSLVPVLAFLVVVTVSITRASISIGRQVSASLRLTRHMHEATLMNLGPLDEAARDCRLAGRVLLVEAPERFSFAYGVLAPRVAVSRGLLEGASPTELRAVLHHERYHVVNLDPLKASLAQTLSAAFFFLPALESLRTRYLAARELSADRCAARICGRAPLAGALLKVVRGPAWSNLEGVAAIGAPELLHVRVAQLETGTEPKLAQIGMLRVTLSLAGATLFATSFLASASVLGAAISTTDLLSSLMCGALPATLGTVAYLAHASRVERRLSVER
ncbi:MAG: M56 family metallopeptidase [Solirubrobacteraceae bacterium]